jgi:hypothetical protein
VTTLESQFVGAWKRASISIDGGAPEAATDVLWLQACNACADLRIPVDPHGRYEAFAGVTTYEEPALTWHHTLDWNGGFAANDRGVVECRDNEMIERGEFERDGCCHTYEETWHRVDPGAIGLVLTGPHAMIVRVGRHCLALRDRRRAGGEFDVRHARIGGIEWTDVAVLGDGAELPRLPVALPGDWTVGSELVIDGGHWRVAERWA